MNTQEIYEEVESEIQSGKVFEEFSKPVFDALDKALETNHPMIISGDQGVGKTFGIKWYAYKNNFDIVSINASMDLREKEKSYDMLRSLLLRKQLKTRLVLIDEVEKDSQLKILRSFIEANKKTAFVTNNIFVCVTNHYWTMKEFVSVFGSFHEQIKAPYKKSLKKYMRRQKINTNPDIERDLRFFRNVLENGEIPEGSISDNTFEAINNFCQAQIKDRDVFATFNNLSSPLWKWIIYNMIHGTFQFRMENVMTFIKHNSEYFFHALRVASESDMYQKYRMLEFILPNDIKQVFLTHPSTLDKKVKI